MHIRARPLPSALDRTRRHGIGLRRPLVMLLAGVPLMCVLIGASATAFAAGLCPGPPHRGSHRADRYEHRDVRDDCDRDDTRVAAAWWDRADDVGSRVCTSPRPRSDTTPPPSPPPAPVPTATRPPARSVSTTGSVPPASAPPSVQSLRPAPPPTVRQPPVLAPPALTVPPSPAIAAPASVPVSIYVITIATLLAAAVIAVAALVLVRRAD